MTTGLHEAMAMAMQSQDEAEGRVYGWLPGVVTDVDVDLKQVKARVGKQGDNESTHWMVQMCPGGVESLPEVGDPIGVAFADGDVHRGAYFYFPQSTTKNRPTQPIPLGTNLVGLINYLIDQFNQFKSDFNNHGHSPGTFTTATGGPVTGVSAAAKAVAASVIAGSPGTGAAATTASDANKGKASDGSVVGNQTSSVIVLSKRSLVR